MDGYFDVLTHLLSLSTPDVINQANKYNETPLHQASLNGQIECVELLLRAGKMVWVVYLHV